MLRVAISGSSGRMGLALKEQILNCSDQYEYVAGLGKGDLDQLTVVDLADWDPNLIDAVVDFSLPDAFYKILDWCNQNNKPLVSGTTGFDIVGVENKIFECAFMHSGNYSLGVAGVVKSIENFKSMDPKIWIDDYHHIKKLDAPSGTAVKIRKKIQEVFKNKEVEIDSYREGDIFGIHNVYIETDQELVTLSHKALNRGVFAEGALNALGWLTGQKPGFYKFEDYLGF